MTFAPGDIVTMDPAHPRWSDRQLADLWADMRLTVEGQPGDLHVKGRNGARHTLAVDGRCGFVRVRQLPAIQVWRFDDAPADLQDLSQHGGDEDWLALVPQHLADEYIPWLDYGSFGMCDISRHPMADGSVVCIGAHA